jgi:hypothetical protein
MLTERRGNCLGPPPRPAKRSASVSRRDDRREDQDRAPSKLRVRFDELTMQHTATEALVAQKSAELAEMTKERDLLSLVVEDFRSLMGVMEALQRTNVTWLP